METTVSSDDYLAVGSLEIENSAYRARLDGEPLVLTPAQFDLLAYLVRNRDRVVTRHELGAAGRLEHVHSVDVTLSSLRRVLGRPFIRNVRNRGWILEPGALGA